MNESIKDPTPAFYSCLPTKRRPRIALMGEFSAGKSTLANLMIGTDPLPMQVVATQLPPVWISYGSEPAQLVDLEGNQSPCDLSRVEGLDPESVAFVRFECQEEILKMCDIIDMPGISDPNMATDVWERIMPLADAVVWCSPSTQAWRQSEAAVWDTVEDAIRQKSILLLTRADALITDNDKAKVLKRVKAETSSVFKKVLMISLLEARDAGDDESLWESSGANAFVANFMDLLGELAVDKGELQVGELPVKACERTSGIDEENVPNTQTVSSAGIVPRRPIVKKSQRTQSEKAPDPSSFTPKFS